MRRNVLPLFIALILATLFAITFTALSWAAPNPESHAQAADDGQEYVVQQGDSLYQISGRFLGDPEAYPAIVAATNAKAATDNRFSQITNPGFIRRGQLIWIPNSPDQPIVTETEPADTSASADQSSADGPNVAFAAPLDGATVPPKFEVDMLANGLTVEPAGDIHEGAGHFHILVDTDFVPAGDVIITDDQHLHYGKGQITTTLELAPGEHVLRLQFANGAHIALEGDQYRDEITVNVQADARTLDGPGVAFAAPLDGATVPPKFEVDMLANGLTVEPAGDIHAGAGHFHILVDTDFVPAGDVIITDDQHLHYGKGQITTTLELAPGEHVLRLQFANGAHIALEGDQYRDEITVNVQADARTLDGLGVAFAAPLDGATVPPKFEVDMLANGLTVEPAGDIHAGAGHFHILVDTDFVPAGDVIITDDQHLHYGKGQITTTLELAPGEHVLRLQFANGAHIALDGDQYRDEITVNVQANARTLDGLGVAFAAPLDGATVPPKFEVDMLANGLTVEPAGDIHAGAGHFHILVDTDFVPAGDVIITDDQHLHYGKGQITTTLELAPGEHVLRLQFANGAHIALEGDQYRDEITVNVQADASDGSGPHVAFAAPLDGANVKSGFNVIMVAEGLTIEPAGDIHAGAGHFHILVDTDFVPAGDVIITDDQHLHFGKGQITTTLELTPGKHVLRLQFANGAHIALDGDQYRDEITVNVTE
ncbi:MAG: DUF4399 domain-containing protein [Caldilineaceae bacterium]